MLNNNYICLKEVSILNSDKTVLERRVAAAGELQQHLELQLSELLFDVLLVESQHEEVWEEEVVIINYTLNTTE